MKKLIIAIMAIAGLSLAANYTPASQEKGVDVVVSGTVTVTAATLTTNTPAYVGQLFIGTASNVVAVAKGLTTNDWIRIAN